MNAASVLGSRLGSLPSAGLNGKVAMVVGAGSSGAGWGIGKAVAATLAASGVTVACLDRSHEAAQETVEAISRIGGAALAVTADVTDEASLAAAVSATLDAFGRLDIVVYSVGILEGGGAVELPVHSWERLMSINVTGAFLTLKHSLPVLPDGGVMLAISSLAAIRYSGVPLVAYSASKAALSHLIKVTALEYASRRIRANVVVPGLMKTPMVERAASLTSAYGQGVVEDMWRVRDAQCATGSMGDAWDVADAVAFLASDGARYITGTELLVDGGLSMRFA